MKNGKKSIMILLLVISMLAILFVGCGFKSSTASISAKNTSGNAAPKMDSTAMTTLFTNTLKTLVTDNTITQDQSDKVLAAVTKDMPTDGAHPNGTAPTTGTKPAGTPPTGTAPTDGTKPTGTPPGDGTKPKDDRLSALVTSNVITQAQADIINQKIQEAMKSEQNINTTATSTESTNTTSNNSTTTK